VGEAISVLILNYNAPEEALKRCVASVDASDYPELAEIVIAENGSTEHVGAARAVAAGFSRARVVDLGRNWGFAGGINRGIAACRSPWVFVLNNDTEVDPGAIRACAEVLAAQPPECLAAVPKLLFLDNRHLIDAVGNAVDPWGAAFNVGIGQLDVGQYDRVERCFGPCFAAGLFRREAFDDDHVGPLDESYFMYYEDVDWNWRANLFGYHFVTAPAARVYHVHSGASRALDYSFKYHLIERNLLATVFANFEGRRAVRVCARRLAAHGRNLVRGPYRMATARILLDAARRFPDTWRKRQQVRSRRVRADVEILRLAQGEAPHFDPAHYAPQRTFANLAAMYRRKALVTGELRYLDIVRMAELLDGSRLRYEPGFIAERLLPLLEGEPDHVRAFVADIEDAQRPQPNSRQCPR
jgi:GT2 family glycosyltransferase